MLRLNQAGYLAGKFFGLVVVIFCTISPVFAAEINQPVSVAVKLGLGSSLTSGVYVHPTSAPVNVPRTIFFVDSRLTACKSQIFSFDTSTLNTQNLISIRFDLTSQPCGVPPVSYPTYRTYSVTPSRVGKLTVRTTRDGSNETTEAEVTTAPATHSARSVNGMWYDPATNGSGVSMHHSPSSDVVFGAWFLYNLDGSTRWYSLQQTFWRGNGDVLEGLLYASAGNCLANSLVACAAKAQLRILPLGGYDPTTTYPQGEPFLDSAIARFTFTSDTAARAEVVDFAGNVLFVSQLVRLPL